MSFFTQAADALLGPVPETKSLPLSTKGASAFGMGAFSSEPLNPFDKIEGEKLLQYAEQNRLAYTLSQPFANRVAATGYQAFAPQERKAGDKVSRRIQGKAGFQAKSLQETGEVTEVPDSKALEIWRKFNSLITPKEGRSFIFQNLHLAGRVFLYLDVQKERADDGAPLVELHAFPKHNVRQKEGGGIELWADNADKPMFDNVKPKLLWEVRRASPACLYSRSAAFGKAASYQLSVEEESSKTLANRYQNNGSVSKIVSLIGAIPAKVRRMADEFASTPATEKANRTYITDLDVKVQNLEEGIADLNLDSSRQNNERDARIAAGIPGEILGITENSNKATSHTASLHFWENVHEPALVLICESLTQWLVPLVAELFVGERDDLIISHTGHPPQDRELIAKVMLGAKTAFTKNEVRAFTGFTEVEGGEEFMTESAPAPLEDPNAKSEDLSE